MWLFRRKSLNDILSSFQQMQRDLDNFYDRVSNKVSVRQQAIDLLVAENATDEVEMERAQVVSRNLRALMHENIIPASDHNEFDQTPDE